MKRVSRDLIADDPFFLLQTTFANAELPLLPPTVPPSVSLESALTDATLDSPPEELMELPALLPNLLAVVSYVSSFFWPFSLLLQRWKKIDETDLRFSFRFSSQTCSTPANGYNTCDAATGACNPGCNAGFTLFQAGNNFSCFAINSDADNCGAPGNVCPASYNGIGSSVCRSGNCRIACPAGYFLRRANSNTNP